MFERFTERARQIVVLSQEESRNRNHAYIGTEHVLMGLVREEEGVGAKILKEFGVFSHAASDFVSKRFPNGETRHDGQIPMTPRAKKILENALREALGLGHKYIGTEHILLGLIREPDSAAKTILMEDFGIKDTERIRGAVVKFLSGPAAEEPKAGTKTGTGTDWVFVENKNKEADPVADSLAKVSKFFRKLADIVDAVDKEVKK